MLKQVSSDTILIRKRKVEHLFREQVLILELAGEMGEKQARVVHKDVADGAAGIVTTFEDGAIQAKERSDELEPYARIINYGLDI